MAASTALLLPAWMEAALLGSVIFSVVYEAGRWSLQRDGVTQAIFDSAPAAERRGRWLTAHAAVQGLEASLEIHDRFGLFLGAWRNESFAPAMGVAPSLAA